MKKSVLAFAALSAFASVASAQTSVTIYGIVDAGFAREDNGGGAQTRLDSGGESGSRLGFEGTESLNDTLSAIFKLEDGFNVDDGTMGQGGKLFGRQAWVGLKGDFGAIKLGRQYTPMRNALDSIDPFDIGLAGDITRMFSDDTVGNVNGFRMDNTVTYSIQPINGFSGQLAYGFGETADNISAKRQLGFSTGYARGPLNLVLAYHSINNEAATGGATRTSLLGGTYDFTVVKAYFGYGWNKADTDAGGTIGDSRDLMAGLSAPLGASTFLGSYIRHKNRLAADSDYNQFALGYTYALSKRTDFYSSYSRIANDDLSKYKVTAIGQTDTLFNVGIRHKF